MPCLRCAAAASLPGFSTCDAGLVLDLSALTAIAIDRDTRTIEVGGGALLGDLDRATVPEGYVVPAAVISHTGVAGLTLGWRHGMRQQEIRPYHRQLAGRGNRDRGWRHHLDKRNVRP
ncbi:FAD-binding protein [Rhizobium sp. CF122]|uniref:FAD-binding protein n=1 Tax=Rhizobium sp. CF122 TaxID=1144312 RepID=UPI003FD077C0